MFIFRKFDRVREFVERLWRSSNSKPRMSASRQLRKEESESRRTKHPNWKVAKNTEDYSLKFRTLSSVFKSSIRGRGAGFFQNVGKGAVSLMKSSPSDIVAKGQKNYENKLATVKQLRSAIQTNVSDLREEYVSKDLKGIPQNLMRLVKDTFVKATSATVWLQRSKKFAQDKSLVPLEFLKQQKKLGKYKSASSKATKAIVPADFDTVLESSLRWEHLEAETKDLVYSIQKSFAEQDEKSIKQQLDKLYSQLYVYPDLRDMALQSGLIRVLLKICKFLKQDEFIVDRARELLAMMGYTPPLKGYGIKILSIDGGGVRGVIALEVLREIESKTGKRTCELFDLICGVSTGSILAFLLGGKKLTVGDCEAMYMDLSKDIFGQNTLLGSAGLVFSHAYYDTKNFEKILQTQYGQVPLISIARDPTLPRIAALSTVVSQERITPYVFRTYTFPPYVSSKYIGGFKYNIWEAIRASAAAPTYFEEFKLGGYLHQDGGIIMNNPTSVAISEAKLLWRKAPLQCVVSLGTGLTLSSRTNMNLEDLDDSSEEIQSSSWKGKFLKVLDSATDTEGVHNTMNELLPSDIYFRLNPYLSEVLKLDESSHEKLKFVQMETKEYLLRNQEKVNFLCERLTTNKKFLQTFNEWWGDVSHYLGKS